MSRLLTFIVLTVLTINFAMAQTLQTHSEREVLGGFDLDKYAKEKYGGNASAVLVENNAGGWKVAITNSSVSQAGQLVLNGNMSGQTSLLPIDMGDVARAQYGDGARADHSNDRADSWYAYRMVLVRATKLGGLDLGRYARIKYGSSAQVTRVDDTAFGWRIVLSGSGQSQVVGIDMQDVAAQQYGQGAQAVCEDQNSAGSWAAYRISREIQK